VAIERAPTWAPSRKAGPVATHVVPGISPTGEKAIRRIASTTVVGIAIAAAVLSFTGLRQLALTAGFSPALAWLFPLIVDGLTLIGSLGVVHATLTGMRAWYPWTLTLTGVGLSVWGNITAADPSIVSRLVHAIPPVVLALSLEALLRAYRYRLQAGQRDSTPAHTAHPAAEDTGSSEPRPQASEPRPAPVPDTFPAPAAALTTVGIPAPAAAPPAGTVREQVEQLLRDNPTITPSDAARTLGKDRSNISKILKELRAEATPPSDTDSQLAA